MSKALTNTILISPSIIATDLTLLGSYVKNFDKNIIDLLHIDVMDGCFVPNLTIGPGYIQNLKAHSSIPLDIHLMIETPELSLQHYINCQPHILTIHIESTRQPIRLLDTIKNHGIKAGISINPSTPIESIFDILPFCDVVLVMSVEPGFYGQTFIPNAIERIKKLNQYIESHNVATVIEVDGGINETTIGDVVVAGARIIVAGSGIFKSNDINSQAQKLKDIAHRALHNCC